MENNIMIFEGNNVEVFEWKGKVLFNPRDVAKCLGLSDITVRRHIQEMNEKQAILLSNSDVKYINFRKLHNTGENFLTESGVCELVFKSNNASHYEKKKLLKFLFPNKEFIYCGERKEIKFLDKLEESLKPFNIVGEKQYKIFNYRIDYYISSLNIAIEYDENDHKTYTYSKQEGRQKEIENELNCKFIRISDKNSDEYNIGFVIKNILN